MKRSLNGAALIDTALMAGVAALLLTKTLSGELIFYIHPAYTPLIAGAGLILLAMALARVGSIVQGPSGPHSLRAGWYLLLVPLLFGALASAQPLGAGALSAAPLRADLVSAPDAAGDDTRRWNLLQWASSLSLSSQALGREADVVGLVYRDAQRLPDGFFVMRYVITCCVADGNGVGLPVIWDDADGLAPDSWVRVRGTIGLATVGGEIEPALLATSVEPTPRPASPYLYP